MSQSTEQPINRSTPSGGAGGAGGFTLVELLVVIAIIVALLAILLPSMRQAIYVANETVCASNMSQIVTTHQSYAADSFGLFATNNDGHMYYARYGQSVTDPSLFRNMVIDKKYFTTPDLMVCPLLADMGIPDLDYPAFISGGYCNWRYAFDNPTSSADVWSGYGWLGGMTNTYAGLVFIDPLGKAIIPNRTSEATSTNYLVTHRLIAWGPGRTYTTDDSHGGVGRIGNAGVAPPESFKTIRNPIAFGDGHVGFRSVKEMAPRLSDDGGARWYYW